ncbi:DNRLRE domain-containing protein, partial [Arenibacter sp. BSSL-BM3]
SDAFPLDSDEDVDTDSDGVGNNADTDDDNDGTPDTLDAFPLDADEDLDTDNDGVGNNADTDDDNDGTPDTSDAFPLGADEYEESEGDGNSVDVPRILAITSFTLVTSDDNKDVMTLKNGDIIDVATLPSLNLNIRANTTSDVESVSLQLSGALNNGRTESATPYAFYGDIDGNYLGQLFPLGIYSLAATPYSGDGLQGDAGIPVNLKFTITNNLKCTFIRDEDGDGYCADIDCDDADPNVFPGALEVCDGIDNNCDGLIDAKDPLIGACGIGAAANLIDATFLQGSNNPSPTGPILRTEQGNRVVYLKFDLGSFKGPVSIAELKMQVTSDPGFGALEVFLGSNSDWTESSLNGNNKPTEVGNALGLIKGSHNLGQIKIWELDIGRLPSGGIITLIVKQAYGNDVAFSSDETKQAPQLIINSNGFNKHVDMDNDTFFSDVDCDDTNPDVFPGAQEVCDGIDNNCDGLIDAEDPLIGDCDSGPTAYLIDATFLQGSSNPSPTGNILRAEQGNRLVYMKFDLGAFRGPITKAQLQMQVASDPGFGTLEVFLGSSSDWTENGLNGTNKPTTVGTYLSAITGMHNLGQKKTWNLDVDRIPGSGLVTLIVKHSNGNDVAFASDETNLAPQLMITYEDSSEIEVTQTLKSYNDLSLFPNPATNATTVSFKLPIKVKAIMVFDMSGRLVRTYNAEEVQIGEGYGLELNYLQPGSYIVKTIDDEGHQFQKQMVIK